MRLRFINKLINVIFPAKCIFCRRLLSYDADVCICGECYAKLHFTGEAMMDLPQISGKSSCDGAISVLQYTGVVKESLIRFKFNNKPCYYRTYGRLIADKLKRMNLAEQFDMVLSVPLHRLREFIRGYNQSLLVSRALSRQLNVPECSSLLKRIRNTDTQSLLDRQARLLNVRGAFIAKEPEKIKGKSILLIDDILTTGSTLEECCKALKQAGAFRVIAAVIASGRKN